MGTVLVYVAGAAVTALCAGVVRIACARMRMKTIRHVVDRAWFQGSKIKPVEIIRAMNGEPEDPQALQHRRKLPPGEIEAQN